MKPRSWALIAVCAIFLIGIAAYAYAESLHDAYEVVSVVLFPNAAREFSYGEEHFDAADPKAYNVDLAEYFFRKVVRSDTSIPYLYHELARIDFLKGKFDEAFVEINLQIDTQGDNAPSSYYVRGLIEGFMGAYASADADFRHYLAFDPYNWAAINDDSWVLLKAGNAYGAEIVTAKGLTKYPANAWLLNSNATELYELGKYERALPIAERASVAVSYMTPQEWSVAYPGNDPAIAAQGLAAFRAAVADNMHSIQAALVSSTVQSKYHD